MVAWLLLLLAVGSLWDQTALAYRCNPRHFGYGSVVCVCNKKQCGKFEPIDKTPFGVITTFISNKNGLRFDRTTNCHFYTKPMKHVDISMSVAINRNKMHQKILGFGGAFTDATGINIAKLSKDLQTSLIDDYFGDNGLRYTCGRIPIGGSDFSTRVYSLDDNETDELLDKFALQPEDLMFKIPFIRMALKASGTRGIKLFGSTWSPPAFMKQNHKLIHGGQLIGQPNGKWYKMYAQYLVKFVQEYQKHNLSMWGLTVVNEPVVQGDMQLSPNQRFNSLAMNSSEQRDFLKFDLGPLLVKSGLAHLKVMIFDNNISTMDEFVSTVLSDQEAASYAHGIAYHWYHNQKPGVNRSVINEMSRKFSNHFLISTEACETWVNKSKHVQLGNWQLAERYAEDIIKDLNSQTIAWVDWNLCLDKQGGPNWISNFVDSPLIIGDEEYYRQPHFYSLAHFSRFLPSESIRLDHFVHAHDKKNPLATVFQRPDKATVLVALNQEDRQALVELFDPAYGYYYFNLSPHTLATLIWY